MAPRNPADRVSTVQASARTAPKGGIHPSICLLSGFGVIVVAALVVHAAFQVLL